MALLGALLSELAFLALSVGLMALSLRKRPVGGLFSALWPGILPALALSGLVFWQLQQPGDPDVKAAHQALMGRFDRVAAQDLPNPNQAGDRQQLMDLGEAIFNVMPALELLLRLALLAPLAVLLRRRLTRVGLAPEAGPLSRWGAPWWLAWSLLGPLFWLLAGHAGAVVGPPWADPLAWNLLVLGTALQFFHGTVVLLGKLAAWSRVPRTRPLVALALAGAFMVLLVLEDARPLLALVVLTGLFDPWLDLRRLHRPPSGAPVDKGGRA